MTEGLGKDYIRRMLDQNLVFSANNRQMLDWVVRGQYPVSLGFPYRLAVPLIEAGLPIKFLPGEAMKEKYYISAGSGGVSVVNRAPHPNAAKVYLNYLLSRQGQLEFVKASMAPSFRVDLPKDLPVMGGIPAKGVEYQLNYKEPYVDLKEEVVEFYKSLGGQ
jgi:iron(III) transport system substrate-binding protein